MAVNLSNRKVVPSTNWWEGWRGGKRKGTGEGGQGEEGWKGGREGEKETENVIRWQ